MKTKILYLLVLLSVALGSCDKYLDINTNPNVASSVEPKMLFGYASASYAGERTSGDLYIPVGLMAQTIASGGNWGWGKGDVYDISPYSYGNIWSTFYISVSNNLNLAIKNAEASNPVNNNAAAQSKVLLASVMYDVTMLYGDVPFTEAWKEDISYPHFDSQETVLNGIISLLDEAIAQFDEASALKIEDFDLFYGGNIAKWKRLAYSLKFKVLMTMVDKVPGKAADIANLVNGNQMINSAADNFAFPFYNIAGKENPKFKIHKQYGGSQSIFFFANNTVFSLMSSYNDPRIPRYFQPGPDAGANEYHGVDTEAEADGYTSPININTLFAPTAPEYLLTYQEILLLKAEVYARGIGVTENLGTANDLFHQGVRAACAMHGVSEANTNSFITNNLPNISGMLKENALIEIYKQQWIDLMDRPLEAFTMWRRSGQEGHEYPALTLPDGAPAGPLIRRYLLSNDEIAANPNAPQGDNRPKYFEKMWFDL